jgi:hypothetical protein
MVVHFDTILSRRRLFIVELALQVGEGQCFISKNDLRFGLRLEDEDSSSRRCWDIGETVALVVAQ